jgi:putative FmdB family regulatory protein
MPLHDFECIACGSMFEEIVPAGMHRCPCPECGAEGEKVYTKSPPILTAIIPAYPGCKKQKAGYAHSHADRPATKIQSTGWTAPKN